MKVTSISSSFEQLCFEEQYASVSSLAGISFDTKITMKKNDSNDTSLCCLVD